MKSLKVQSFIMFFALVLVILSCAGQQEKNKKLIASNPYLIGTWQGEGNFFNVDTKAEFGSVKFLIVISMDSITGKVDEARLTKTSIAETNYGFETRGILDSKIRKDKDLDRDHLIIMLVLPEENRNDIISSDAGFHMKTNYTWDFGMRVGRVVLTKEP